ncbi:MAG TPA: hypothetical protein VEZ11_03140, partial [Thermoanaerobaculia bacterium]|nr:hypothetical protein [Thermoanaerobaculia bacterium]
MALYLKEAFDAPAWPATQWSARLDPQKLVPLLERMGDNPGFRFVTPRLARSVKDLRNWTGALANAKAIEAADSDDGRIEEIRVRIASK